MMAGLWETLSQPHVQRLGWTLLHFVWQGTCLSFVLALGLAVMRQRSANVRYASLCIGLFVMAMFPIATFVILPSTALSRLVARSEVDLSDTSFKVKDPANQLPTEPSRISVAKRLSQSKPVDPSITPLHQPSQTDVTPVLPEPVSATKSVGKEFISDAGRSAMKNPASTFMFRGRIEAAIPWIVASWFVGVVLFSVWHCIGLLLANRLKHRDTQPISIEIKSLFDRIARRMGIHKTIVVLESTAAYVPVVIGWFKPVLLLPTSVLSGLSSDELEAILAHELAHIRRHDILVNMLQAAIETLLFYHPAVWWLSKKIRLEREFCADDLATHICGSNETYARALLTLAENARSLPHGVLAATGSSLAQRIHRVLGTTSDRSSERPGSWMSASLVGLLVVAGVVVSATTGAQNTSDPIGEQQTTVEASTESQTEVISQPNAVKPSSIRVASSAMILRAEGVEYKGAELSQRPDRHHGDILKIGDREYLNPVIESGLIAHNTSTHKTRNYEPFELAESAGWFEKSKNEYRPSSLRGLFRQGDLLWMGTNGVGVLTYDTSSQRWARHDIKPRPIIGHHMQVVFADKNYVFADHGYHRQLGGVEPALYVYSAKHLKWLQLTHLSTRGAQLGKSTDELFTQVGWDFTDYEDKPYIPVPIPTGSSFATPEKIEFHPKDQNYELIFHAGWKVEEVATHLYFPKSDLDKAFDDHSKKRAEAAGQPDMAELAKRLASDDWQTKTDALEAVARIISQSGEDTQAYEVLVEPLFSYFGWGGEARENSQRVKELLAKIGKPAVRFLLAKLKSEAARERWSALQVIASIGEPTAPVVNAARPLVSDDDAYVRRVAIRCLDDLGPKARPAVKDLQAAINDPVAANRMCVHAALVHITGQRVGHIDAIASYLASRDPATSEASFAASTLGRLGPLAKGAEPQLRTALMSPIAQTRVDVAAALGAIGADSDETITALIDRLRNDPEVETRRSSAVSLGTIGQKAKSAIPALRDALGGGAGWWVAARSLGLIGSADVVPILTQALENDDDGIRSQAILALGQLASLSQPAIPALEKCRRNDPLERNRKAAGLALAHIRAAALKDDLDDFTMTVWFNGQSTRTFVLSVIPLAEMTATTSKENAIKVIDALATENLLGRATSPLPDKFSPGWNILLAQGKNRPRWHRHLGRELTSLADQPEFQNVLDALDGQAAIAFRLFLTTTNRRLPFQATAMFTPAQAPNRGQEATGIAFSPDGKLIASANTQQVHVRNASNGHEVHIFSCKNSEQYRGVQFVQQGKSLAIAGNFGIKIWNVGADVIHLANNTYSLVATSYAISPSGVVALVAGRKLHVWAKSREALQTPAVEHPIDVVAISPDGKRVAGGVVGSPPGDEPRVTVWDVATRAELARLPGLVTRIAFSSSGNELLAMRDNEISVWDLTTEKIRHRIYEPGFTPICFAQSPDGNRIAAGSHSTAHSSGEVLVWDFKSQQSARVSAHTQSIGAVTFSADGNRLATTTDHGEVKIWQISKLPQQQGAITPERRGRTRAQQDIKTGIRVILYYGKPWSVGKPLVDDASGLPVKIVAGSDVTAEFVAETNAYNETMRAAVLAAKQQSKKYEYEILPRFGHAQVGDALRALKDVPKPWTFLKLSALYAKEKDEKKRAHYLWILACNRDGRTAALLGEALTDEAFEVRVAATYAILEFYKGGLVNGVTEHHMLVAQKWWETNKRRLLETSWGEPVKGLQLGIANANPQLAKANRVPVGEGVSTKAVVRNNSDVTRRFTTHVPHFRVPQVEDSKGQQVRVAIPVYDGGVKPVVHVVKAHETIELPLNTCPVAPGQIIDNATGFQIATGPGRYKLSTALSLTIENKENSIPKGNWIAKLASGQLDLEVVVGDFDKITARVAAELNKYVNQFTFKLVYLGDEKPPLPSVRLTTRDSVEEYPANWTTVKIDKPVVKSLIHYLATQGFLWRSVVNGRSVTDFPKPHYFISVEWGKPSQSMMFPLGWGPTLEPRLQALSGVLLSDSAAAVQAVTTKLGIPLGNKLPYPTIAESVQVKVITIHQQIGRLEHDFPAIKGFSKTRVSPMRDEQGELIGARFFFKQNVTPNSKRVPPGPIDKSKPYCFISLTIHRHNPNIPGQPVAADFSTIETAEQLKRKPRIPDIPGQPIAADQLKRPARDRVRIYQLGNTNWRTSLNVITGDEALSRRAHQIFDTEIGKLLPVLTKPADDLGTLRDLREQLQQSLPPKARITRSEVMHFEDEAGLLFHVNDGNIALFLWPTSHKTASPYESHEGSHTFRRLGQSPEYDVYISGSWSIGAHNAIVKTFDLPWQRIVTDSLLTVDVERVLYERPNDRHFYIQVRLTNLTSKSVGVDLREYDKVIYPNQWGFLGQDHRIAIDERRINPDKIDAAHKMQLIADFRAKNLTLIPAGESVTYLREFNASGRKDVDKQKKDWPYLFVSLDGQLFVTDGNAVENVNVSWDRKDREKIHPEILIPTPIPWQQVPAGALIVTRDGLVREGEPTEKK